MAPAATASRRGGTPRRNERASRTTASAPTLQLTMSCRWASQLMTGTDGPRARRRRGAGAALGGGTARGAARGDEAHVPVLPGRRRGPRRRLDDQRPGVRPRPSDRRHPAGRGGDLAVRHRRAPSRPRAPRRFPGAAVSRCCGAGRVVPAGSTPAGRKRWTCAPPRSWTWPCGSATTPAVRPPLPQPRARGHGDDGDDPDGVRAQVSQATPSPSRSSLDEYPGSPA